MAGRRIVGGGDNEAQGMADTDSDEVELLHRLEAAAEAAYDAMYDAGSPSGATAFYSDAKEALVDAIALARRIGHSEDATRLEARLEHIKAVFRSQFT
jgi:hypothetical protein